MTASPFDVVMAGGAARTSRRTAAFWLAWLVALLLHGALVLAAWRSGPSLEAWSAELALEVHEALVDDQVIELATPEVATPEPVVAEPERAAVAAPSRHHAPSAQPPQASAPPAEASAVLTQDSAPIDLTGETIVTGGGASVAGGVVATHGSGEGPSDVPVPTAAPAAAVPKAPALTRVVGLEPGAWRCDWPREAVAEDIYEQTVVLRVVVRADGHVEAAQLIEDPGHGFGRAALACAKQTAFVPALNERGEATRAVSPPIRVRFTR